MNRIGGIRVAAGLLGVVGVGVALGSASRRIQRHYGQPPRRDADGSESAPADASDIALTPPSGLVLRGWLRAAHPLTLGEPRRRTATALVVHGWGGSATDMLPVSDLLHDAGLHVLLLDTLCHGRSDLADFASMPTFADDLRTALTWLRTQPHVDPARIVLVGHSVGAGACLFVAADDPKVAAVVAMASMADPQEFMSFRLRPQLPGLLSVLALRYIEHTIGHRFTEFAPVNTIGRIRKPVLLLHGERDTTVPLADAYRLHSCDRRHSTLVVLPNADHNGVDALGAARPALLDFLRDADLVSAAS